MDMNYMVWIAIPQELKRKGWNNAYQEWLEFSLPKGKAQDATQKFDAANEVWLLAEASDGIIITSDSGTYSPNTENFSIKEHRHTGQIKIVNKGASLGKVKFVRIRKELNTDALKLQLQAEGTKEAA